MNGKYQSDVSKLLICSVLFCYALYYLLNTATKPSSGLNGRYLLISSRSFSSCYLNVVAHASRKFMKLVFMLLCCLCCAVLICVPACAPPFAPSWHQPTGSEMRRRERGRCGNREVSFSKWARGLVGLMALYDDPGVRWWFAWLVSR